MANKSSAQEVALLDAIGATTLPATVVNLDSGIANGSGDLNAGEVRHANSRHEPSRHDFWRNTIANMESQRNSDI